MKKQLLFSAIIFCSQLVLAQTTIISATAAGTVFSPNSVTINLGDTIDFQLSGNHNAVEVSQTTWNANGTTPIPGGFSVSFGGGIVTGLTVGTHYYVCTAHASMGMKGIIIVQPIAGIDEELSAEKINIAPNPTSGKFTIGFQNTLSSEENKIGIQIYNTLGGLVYTIQQFQLQISNEIDLSAYEAGIYFIKIQDKDKTYAKRIVLE